MTNTNSDRPFLAAAVVMMFTVATPASAEEFVYDDARVIHVEPIVETVTVPSRSVECSPAIPAEAGDLRAADASLDLVTAIRTEAARPPQEDRCVERVEHRTGERVVGYRVHYRYAGDDYEEMVDEHPGERLRVRVSVSPEK